MTNKHIEIVTIFISFWAKNIVSALKYRKHSPIYPIYDVCIEPNIISTEKDTKYLVVRLAICVRCMYIVMEIVLYHIYAALY